MDKTVAVTAALEDYLEAIFNLCRFDKAARSRDIAETLNVHKSTVTAALKSLGHMNLINYSPYEAVTLTPEGRKVAEDVVRRHAALNDFFVNVLHVDAETAETAACGMEHAVPRVIVEKLAEFASSMRDCPRIAGVPQTTGNAERCAACMEKETAEAKTATRKGKAAVEVLETLDRVAPGTRVTVVALKGGGDLKKRLSEMGLIKGEAITVERIAPMGDPIEIRIKRFRLSLRKEEAAKVVVDTNR